MTLSPPGHGMRSEVSIERELGIGERHLRIDEIAMKRLVERDFSGQAELAESLHKKVTSYTGTPERERLSDDERNALAILQHNTQLRGGFDASLYMKQQCGLRYEKDSVGYSAHTDRPGGFYSSETRGVERSVGVDGAKATFYEEVSRRSGELSEKHGVRLEAGPGVLRGGINVNNRQTTVYAKLESPPLPDYCNVRFGAQLEAEIPTGNARARALAQEALSYDRQNAEWNRSALTRR